MMSRFFDKKPLNNLVSSTVTIHAWEVKEGDIYRGLRVDHIELDLGMVVIVYESGNFSIHDRTEYVKVTRHG